jgi:hypothetical protein
MSKTCNRCNAEKEIEDVCPTCGDNPSREDVLEERVAALEAFVLELQGKLNK